MQAGSKIDVAWATGRVGRHLVEVLKAQGHDVVAMSRSSGVDVVTGDSLAQALAGVECIIDVASTPSPDQRAATQFFTAAARNLHQAGVRAGGARVPGRCSAARAGGVGRAVPEHRRSGRRAGGVDGRLVLPGAAERRDGAMADRSWPRAVRHDLAQALWMILGSVQPTDRANQG